MLCGVSAPDTEAPAGRRPRLNWPVLAAMVSALASAVAAGAAILAWHDGHIDPAAREQLALAQRGQIADRHDRAVEQLGKSGPANLLARVGGLYALERLASDSPVDEPVIIEEINTFVHIAAAKPDGRCSGRPVAPDVQTALTVLGRRDLRHDGDVRLDLSDTCLTSVELDHAELADARLTGADLRYAHLDGARLANTALGGADLRGARLVQAHLAGASLTGARLTDANLFGADLTDAALDQADLGGANIQRAKMQGAGLFQARLVGATLGSADLTMASLGYADAAGARFGDATLDEANLNCANLTNATFAYASLKYAHLEGADFRGADTDGADFEPALPAWANEFDSECALSQGR
jgi:uncharacterized protein YjbI with pentapeptide repeats